MISGDMVSEFQDRFRSLVRGYLESRGKPPSEIKEADDHLLEVHGRILQLRLGGGGRMLLSTMVFYNDGVREDVLEGPIAEFNAYYLLSGGYCLAVAEPSGSLYVEQALTVKLFDVERLARHLGDFADRAASCTRWYLNELKARTGEPAERQPIFG